MARVNVTSTGTGGSGAVASVAGRTGAVVLTAADVGAGQLPAGVLLDSGIVIPSGADITGILGTSGSKAAAGNDSRLSDARTPTAHKTSHATGGSDALTAADVGATTAAAALAAAKGVSLDQFVSPAADVAWNAKKITGLANGSAAQDAAAFGQIPLPGAVGGPAKYLRRTSSSGTISSSAALANDDTLLFAMGASDVWDVELFAVFLAADSSGLATTADAKIGWSVPTGATGYWGWMGNASSTNTSWGASSTASSPSTSIAALSTALAFGMVTALNVGVAARMIIVGDGTHSGNVNMQWAQNTSNAATLQILINSWMRCTRIA